MAFSTDEIRECIADTIAELAAACPATLPDIFGGIDGWSLSSPNEAGVRVDPEDEPDMQEHLADALDRWGDRKFATINQPITGPGAIPAPLHGEKSWPK